MTDTQKRYFPIPLLILMAFVPFVAIVSELMPSGILPQMSESFGIPIGRAAQIVGIYAISAAVLTIPVVFKTTHWNRKAHLLTTLSFFAVATLGVGLTTNFYVALLWRVLGGLCAGVLWSTIAAYGMKIVDEALSGTATALIMAGTPIGLSLGIPLLTKLGLSKGWSMSFYGLSAFLILLIILGAIFLPSIEGERLDNDFSFIEMLKKPGISIINAITLFTIVGHYSVYVYIVNLTETIQFAASLETAQTLFGIGSIIAVVINLLFIDSHFKELLLATIGISAISLAIFLFVDNHFLQSANFLIWGMTFSSSTTIFLNGVSRQVDQGKDVAIAVFESVFNVSIMFASSLGGFLLTSYNMTVVLVIAVISFTIGFFLTMATRHKIR